MDFPILPSIKKTEPARPPLIKMQCSDLSAVGAPKIGKILINLVDFVRENTGDADSPFGKIRVERAEKPGFLRTAYKGFALLLLFYCAIIK